MKDQRALVVGAGSIGQRHRQVLGDLGVKIATMSRRHGVGEYTSLNNALEEYDPGYVVIATETESHLNTLQELHELGFRDRVLVEKPLTHQDSHLEAFDFSALFVGYNLRFHPAVQRMRQLLSGQRVLSAQIRAGQYLPDWRPERDYQSTESVGPGGGVLLDLSHELDLVNWLFGPAKVLFGQSVRTGELLVENEDLAVGVLALPRSGIVSFELNYLDRTPLRQFVVSTPRSTYVLDLNSGSLRENGVARVPGPIDRNSVFRVMHESALSSGNDLCGVEEAMLVVRQVLELRGLVASPSSRED